MFDKIYKTEREFRENCLISYKIYDFVDSLESDTRWFFDVYYEFYIFERKYQVLFKSYITEEYKDYVLSIEAVIDDNNNVDIRVIKKIDNLLHNNEI
ncbi:hypothetical protein [Clostridium disporicum]|uniref:hypothetical protein n=1 Tax=Clostridium disporicum TaxID=84024 RepID=UPI0034A3F9DB